MNLIISLLGNNKINLLSTKFIYSKKKNISLLDNIVNQFNFCSKIFIICDKKLYNSKIYFPKNKKINLIFSKKTNNQIQSILKLKDKIKINDEVFILNHDSIFELSLNKRITGADGAIFSINQEDIKRNLSNKDTFVIKNNKINKIFKKRKSFHKTEKVSAGLYFLKRWSDFVETSLKIKNLNRKKIHVIDIFVNLIKSKKIITDNVKNFTCLEDEKKMKEYIFWKKYFLINKNNKDNLNTLNIQNIIPSAGEGSRHKKLGYRVPKPLIPISGKLMYERSLESLPNPPSIGSFIGLRPII